MPFSEEIVLGPNIIQKRDLGVSRYDVGNGDMPVRGSERA